MGNLTKSIVLVIVALFLTSLVTVPSAILVKAETTWSVQTIDKNAVGAGFIAVDSNNNPHIVYRDYFLGNETGYVMYASWNGSNWSIQQVTSDFGAMDFALDSHNNPHILCCNGTDLRDLVYASWTGLNWTFQIVESQLYYLQYAALALDSDGNPHIAYSFLRVVENQTVIGEGYVLKYASWTNSGWHFERVDSGITDKPFSLAIDSAGIEHIMYLQSQELVYAVSSSSGWNKQTVLENDPWVSNMVLDSSGYPNFIYLLKSLDDPDNAFMFCRWNGSDWSSQEVTSNGTFNSINFGFLALDQHNYPHIDFCNNHALMYATWNGTNWDIQKVVESNASGPGPLKIDSKGNPHISYGGTWTVYSLSYQMYASTAETSGNLPSQPNIPITIAVTVVVVLAAVIVLLFLYNRYRKTLSQNKPNV